MSETTKIPAPAEGEAPRESDSEVRARVVPSVAGAGSGNEQTTNITPWPKSGRPADIPAPIKRPCDWGLEAAIYGAETQLGTIEAYNRLVAAAVALRARIDAGHVKPQNPLYAVDIRGG